MTVFEKIVNHYGLISQKCKAMEELAELIRAISRDGVPNIVEEIADVMIMLEQIKVIYRINDDDIWRMMSAKLSRTLNQIYDEKVHDAIEKAKGDTHC